MDNNNISGNYTLVCLGAQDFETEKKLPSLPFMSEINLSR